MLTLRGAGMQRNARPAGPQRCRGAVHQKSIPPPMPPMPGAAGASFLGASVMMHSAVVSRLATLAESSSAVRTTCGRAWTACVGGEEGSGVQGRVSSDARGG